MLRIRIQLNPDPAKNLNPDPEELESGSGSKLFLNTMYPKHCGTLWISTKDKRCSCRPSPMTMWQQWKWWRMCWMPGRVGAESWTRSRLCTQRPAVCSRCLCVQDEAAPMMCMRNIETGKSWKFQCKCYWRVVTRGAEADQNHFLGREFKPLQRGDTRGVAPEGWHQRGGFGSDSCSGSTCRYYKILVNYRYWFTSKLSKLHNISILTCFDHLYSFIFILSFLTF